MVKYNVENVSYMDNIKEIIKVKSTLNSYDRLSKARLTNIERYGVTNPFLIDKEGNVKKSKISRLNRGQITPEEKLSEYKKYKKKVQNMTHKNKVLLFKAWDGYDYYDGEYIGDNFKYKWYEPCYPNVDHKYSIMNGFKCGINPEIISNIDNLCITKRSNNMKKSSKNHDNFFL